jgi:hypothetical protein
MVGLTCSKVRSTRRLGRNLACVKLPARQCRFCRVLGGSVGRLMIPSISDQMKPLDIGPSRVEARNEHGVLTEPLKKP